MDNEKDKAVHAEGPDDTDRRFEESLERWNQSSSYRGTQETGDFPSYERIPRKLKFIAGLLAFFIPGTGHFYLGLMQRGLFMMIALIIDIYAIVHTVTSGGPQVNVPLVTLFGMLVPVIYFYNIFDALQSTDAVNAELRLRYDPLAGMANPAAPIREFSKPRTPLGWILIIGGCFIFLASNKPAWLQQAFDALSSYLGAAVLIGAGLFLYWKDKRK